MTRDSVQGVGVFGDTLARQGVEALRGTVSPEPSHHRDQSPSLQMVSASAGHAGRPPHFCVVTHPSLTPKNPRGLPPGSRLLTIGSEFLKSLNNKPKGAKSRGWGWGPFRRPAEGARWPTQGTAPLPASGPGARSGRRGGCPQASGGIVPLPMFSQAPPEPPSPGVRAGRGRPRSSLPVGQAPALQAEAAWETAQGAAGRAP